MDEFIDNYADDSTNASNTYKQVGQKTLEDVWFLKKDDAKLSEQIFDFLTFEGPKQLDRSQFEEAMKLLKIGMDDVSELTYPINKSKFVTWLENEASIALVEKIEEAYEELTNVQIMHGKRQREEEEKEVQALHRELMLSQKKRKINEARQQAILPKKKKSSMIKKKPQRTSRYIKMFM
jgi:hypothetical protein